MPLRTEIGLGPGDNVLDGDPVPPTKRGTAAPTFRSMSLVTKRSPISATAEHLFLLFTIQAVLSHLLSLAGSFFQRYQKLRASLCGT